MNLNVLFIGDEQYFRTVIAHELRLEGCRVEIVLNLTAARDILEAEDFSVVIIAFPSVDFKADELLQVIRKMRPDLPTALYTDKLEFVDLMQRFEGTPLLDVRLSLSDLCDDLHLIACGQSAPRRANLQSRLDKLLKKKAEAEQFRSVGAAIKRQYDSTTSLPLPEAWKAKLEKGLR